MKVSLTATTEENIEEVREAILYNHQVTVIKVARHLCVTHGFANMGFIKVCARWVPKQLTEEKGNPLTACPGLLNGYHEEGDAF
jgi:hypothetical protein